VNQVGKLKNQYPTAKVKTTGHSLGAALATLTAMDLYRYGYTDVQCYNFGSPRVGDQAFSAFVGTKMTNFWRVTHLKDMVVHNPGSGTLLDFWHVCQEQYEDAFGNTKNCSATVCEDSTCADQWAPW
jgi:predicted lipase